MSYKRQGEGYKDRPSERVIGTPLGHPSRSNRTLQPIRMELTPEQARAAGHLATFIREGVQPPKGTLKDGRTNPEAVIGEALITDGVKVGDPEMDDRIQRAMAGLGLIEVVRPEDKAS